MTLSIYPYAASRLWDEGIAWFTNRTVEPSATPVTLQYVLDQVLRVANGDVENEQVLALMDAAVDAAEEATERALMPQTWQLILSAFPCGSIVLPRPPLVSVDAITYVDTDGNEQTLSASPADYEVVLSGRYKKAEIRPVYGTSWPSTRCQRDAVTITFQAGYASAELVPALIKQGICVHIVEQYKQRSLSVSGLSVSARAPLDLSHFWRKVY